MNILHAWTAALVLAGLGFVIGLLTMIWGSEEIGFKIILSSWVIAIPVLFILVEL